MRYDLGPNQGPNLIQILDLGSIWVVLFSFFIFVLEPAPVNSSRHTMWDDAKIMMRNSRLSSHGHFLLFDCKNRKRHGCYHSGSPLSESKFKIKHFLDDFDLVVKLLKTLFSLFPPIEYNRFQLWTGR